MYSDRKSKMSTCGTKDERQLQFSTFWFDYCSKLQLIITYDSVSLQFPLMPKIFYFYTLISKLPLLLKKKNYKTKSLVKPARNFTEHITHRGDEVRSYKC